MINIAQKRDGFSKGEATRTATIARFSPPEDPQHALPCPTQMPGLQKKQA
jgi:hypothetical protein